MLYGVAWGTRGWVYISSHDVGYDIPSLSARYYVLFDVLRVRLVYIPPPPCVSVVSLSVSPDDGSGPDEVPCCGEWTLLNIGQFLFGVVCVRVELAVVFCCRVFPSSFSQFKIWVFTAGFFTWGRLASFP